MGKNGWAHSAFLTLIVFGSALGAAPACAGQAMQKRGVTIFRDVYGIPHIYAQDTYSLFYGYGYALATDRLFQMEMSKRTVLGAVAEVLGKEYVDFDKGVRSNYSPASIREQYEALPKAQKEIFTGYAAGMNARIDEVTADNRLLPREYVDFGFAPSRWSPLDVIMIFVGTFANRFSDFNTEIDNRSLLQHLVATKGVTTGWDMFNQLKWRNDPAAPTTVPSRNPRAARRSEPQPMPPMAPADRYDVADLAKTTKERLEQEQAVPSKPGLGLSRGPGYLPGVFSNCWIAGGKRAAGGGSILMNGPQFGDFVPGYVFEAGLHGAGFDVVGATPFGYPFLMFGHNGHIAWASTAGLGDLVDMYEEQLNPSDPFRYKFRTSWRKMEKRTDTIPVKHEPPLTVDIYRTVHGFVVRFDPADNRAFAKKRSWEGFEVQSLVAWIESTRAMNHHEWIAQASKFALTINWYYADREGNIGYVHTGRYPARKAGHDGRLPAPGTGEMEWIGIQPFSRNPQVYNPEQGFIVNWNNKPADYWDGPDIWFWNWGSADRVHVIEDAMKEKEKYTPAEIWAMIEKFSSFDQNVGYFLPFLVQAVKDAPNSREARAVALLERWDARRMDGNFDGKYDSPAQAIMDKWMEVVLKNTLEDDIGPFYSWYARGGPLGPGEVTLGGKVLYHCLLGDKSSIENKYDFFNGVPQQQVVLASLTQALAQLESEYGTADMTQWNAPVRPHVFSTKNFVGIPQTNPAGTLSLPVWMNRGTESNMMVLEPGRIHGVNVCPPGQSGFIGRNDAKGAHYSDQMDLYRDFRSKPMLFELRDVQANTESVTRLDVPPAR